MSGLSTWTRSDANAGAASSCVVGRRRELAQSVHTFSRKTQSFAVTGRRPGNCAKARCHPLVTPGRFVCGNRPP